MKAGVFVLPFYITLLLANPACLKRLANVEHGSNNTTYIAENGTDGDNDYCVNGGIEKPCKTFMFVMTRLTKCHDQCIVYLLYDQTVYMNSVQNLQSNLTIIGGREPVTLTILKLGMKPSDAASYNTLQFYNISLLVTYLGLRVGRLDDTPINSGSVIFENVHFKAHVNFTTDTSPFNLISLYSYSHIDMTNCTLDLSNEGGNDAVTMKQVNVFYAYRFRTLVLDHCSFQYEFKDGSFSVFATGSKASASDGAGQNTIKILNSSYRGFLRSIAFFRLFHSITGSIHIENTIFSSNIYCDESTTMETGVAPDLVLIQPAYETFIKSTEFTNNNMQLIKVDLSVSPSSSVFVLLEDVIAAGNQADYVNLISVWRHQQRNISSNVTFHNVVIKDNTQRRQCINELFTAANEMGKSCLVYFEFTNVTLSNSSFINNSLTTPLGIQNGLLYVAGDIFFVKNKACDGGGVRLNRSHLLSNAAVMDASTTNSTVSFISNAVSERGAAIYTDCFNITPHQNLMLQFKDNSANGLIRSNIYLDADGCVNCQWYTNYDSYFKVLIDNSLPLLLSYPTQINIAPVFNTNSSAVQHQLDIFPGEEIVLKLDVNNCGIYSSCIAEFKLVCGHDLLPCSDFQISGFPLLTIRTGVIYTNLTIKSHGHQNTFSNETRNLQITCRDISHSNFSSGMIPIEINKCVAGMKADENLTCSCPTYQNHFQCSSIRGAMCVEKGYWIGFDDINKSSIITHPCSVALQHVNCSRYYVTTCPRDITTYGDPADFELLAVTPEGFQDQCIDNHDGLLCMYCRTNYTPTYFTMDCIPDSGCRDWHPVVLLLITVVLNIIVGSALVMGVQPRLNVGLGYLYGPFFYLAALNHIVLPTKTYTGLSIVVRFYTTLYLLEYQILGYAPLCFFKHFNLLYNVGIQFLNPLILSLILLITVILAKLVPRVFLRLQPNPVQSMSVVLLVSYWSLTKTSVQILLYTKFENKPGVFPILHPTIPYFSGVHFFLVIIAGCVLVFLSFHLLTLILSQFIGFYRLKPFLDQFQSCYQDKYRWYSVAYAFAMITMAPVAITGYEQIAKTIILTATLLQCIIQPYKKKWLNITSTLFLVDLAFLILLNDNDGLHDGLNVLITWLLVMGPLLYIFIGTCVLLLNNIGLFGCLNRRGSGARKGWEWARKTFGRRSAELTASIQDREREPIIGVIQRAQYN